MSLNTPNGRKADADALGADRRAGRLGDLEHEAGAVLDGTAVLVGAPVAGRADELLEEVAVRGVQLDAVEAGGHRIARGRGELVAGGDDVGEAHGLGHRMRLRPGLVGVHLAGCGDRRGRQQARAGRQVVRVPDPAGVHELEEDLRSAGVRSRGHGPPAGQLLGREHARDSRIAEPVRRGAGALGDDQSCGGPLAVVLRHERGRDVARGTAARHRRQHDAVLQAMRAQREGGEQRAARVRHASRSPGCR
jgi:hypothetical protein